MIGERWTIMGKRDQWKSFLREFLSKRLENARFIPHTKWTENRSGKPSSLLWHFDSNRPEINFYSLFFSLSHFHSVDVIRQSVQLCSRAKKIQGGFISFSWYYNIISSENRCYLIFYNIQVHRTISSLPSINSVECWEKCHQIVEYEPRFSQLPLEALCSYILPFVLLYLFHRLPDDITFYFSINTR